MSLSTQKHVLFESTARPAREDLDIAGDIFFLDHRTLSHVQYLRMTCLVLAALLALPSIPQRLELQTYTMAEGLVSNNIKFLHQDQKGYIWIGTTEGTTVYDGVQFSTFSSADGLPFSGVYDIAEDSAGTIWLATHVGLRKYDGKRFHLVWPRTPGVGFDYVYAVMVDPAGTVWFAGGQGIFQVVGDSIYRLERFQAPTEDPHFASNGTDLVWVLDHGIIWQYFVLQHRWVRVGEPPAGGWTASILAGHDSTMWLLQGNGALSEYCGSTLWATRTDIMGPARMMLRDPDDTFWIGGDDGLVHILGSDFLTAPLEHFDTRSGLPHNLILSGLADREGILWFGTGKEGVAKLTSRQIRTVSLPFAHRWHNNAGTAMDETGHLWIATSDRLLQVFQDPSGVWHQEQHLQQQGLIRSVLLDRKQQLWVDFPYGNLCCYQRVPQQSGKTILVRTNTLRPGASFPEGERLAIAFDRNDNLWFSIQRLGVGVVDLRTKKLIQMFTGPDGDQLTSVRAILPDSKGNIWMGDFFRGLSIISKRQDGGYSIRHITKDDGLPDNSIRSLYEADDGSIWIGTRYGGIAVYHNGVFHNLDMRDGLLSNTIWSLCRGENGTIWAGSAGGLQRISEATLHPEPSAITEPSISNCGFLPDGRLWGISADRLILSEIRDDMSVPPLVHMQHTFVNEEMVDPSLLQELSHDRNNFRFEFIGVSFREEKKMKYFYRLEGFESSWLPSTQQRAVTYANLEPGSYRFEVRAVNAAGTQSAEAAQFSFRIAPPFWRLWWFQLLVVCAVAASLRITLRWRAAQLREREARRHDFERKLLALQESERKRIAAGLHDSLGQNLLILKNSLEQAAIGPDMGQDLHSLSEIAQQSINEVREIAFDLHPHVLDRLGLHKAIETAVEKISRACPTSIQTIFTDLPGKLTEQNEIGIYRIVQEALSNIVKHARANNAMIHLSATDGVIRLTISDDGAGFDSAEYLRRPPERWSLGLLNIAERVRLLRGEYTLRSEPGKGTTVSVQIPAGGGT